MFKAMWTSVLNTASDPDNIEFVIYRDKDDTSVYEYPPNHKVVIGERRNDHPSVMANACQKEATGPIFGFLGDNHIFETKGWDTLVLNEFNKYQDKIVLVCPDNDDWPIWGFGTIGFIHHNWIDATGRFLPEIDGSQGADRWLGRVARMIGRSVHLKEFKEKHIKVKDKPHRERLRIGRDNKWSKKYFEVVGEREKDINKLKTYINEFEYFNTR